MRISRIASLTSSSVSVPRPRTSASVAWSFSARVSNMPGDSVAARRGGTPPAKPVVPILLEEEAGSCTRTTKTAPRTGTFAQAMADRLFRARDPLLAVVVALGSLGDVLALDGVGTGERLAVYGVCLVIAVCLSVRRRAPLATLAAAQACLAGIALLGST